MPVLLLPPRITPDSQELLRAAVEQGWDVERLVNWRPSLRLREMDLVLYGEPLFADIVAEPLGLVLLEPTPDWLVHLHRRYLQRDVEYMTLAAEKRWDAAAFMKPALDKCFPARVYTSGTDLPTTIEVLPDTTPVLVAEPVHWEIEFRCFVLERRLAAMSPYLRSGELAQAADGSWPASTEEGAEAERFLQLILADAAVSLPPAVTLDIGSIAGRGWAVVEANAAWGSGIYSCSPEHILAVLRRATLKEDAVSPADRAWARPLPEVLR